MKQTAELYIKQYVETHKHSYICIKKNVTISTIYKLFKLGQYVKHKNNPFICYYYGLYNEINKDYDMMFKYYSLARKFGYTNKKISNCYSIIYDNYSDADLDSIKEYCSMGLNHEDSNSHDGAFKLGYHYHYTEINYKLMKIYYLIAIKYKNHQAAYRLGHYYQFDEKNYDLMKKYYDLAINYGNNPVALNNLGYHYQFTEKNYDLAKKYLLLAIDNNNESAMTNLGIYYNNIEKNGHLAKKYYTMAVEVALSKGTADIPNIVHNLAQFYRNEPDIKMAKKYYLLGVEHNCGKCMVGLGDYYRDVERNYDLMKKYYWMGIYCNRKQDFETVPEANATAKNCLKSYYCHNTNEKTFSDAMYFYHTMKYYDLKYIEITRAFREKYKINYHLITDYVYSVKLSMMLLKYTGLCIDTQHIYKIYTNIMAFLYISRKARIPIFVKFNIIGLICD